MEGLERMLTFMSDEDRTEALALYERMFDDADDEASLARSLESPTRQAFVIARAYDANRRKQSSADDEEAPAFVRAILKVYEDSVPLPLVAAAKSAPLPEDEPLPAPMEEPVDESEPEEPLRFSFPEDEKAAEEELPPRRPVLADQVTLFDEESEPVAEENAPWSEEPSIPEEPPVPPRRREASRRERRSRDDELRALVLDELRPEDVARESIRSDRRNSEAEEPERETNVPLLILFVILAVPLTLLGVALLLIPTLLSLLLAGAAIVSGCAGLMAAFGGFAVFADILIVFGCSIVALALGLLFLWLFIWFVGGPIAGLVRAVIRLGGRWCSKEVSA